MRDLLYKNLTSVERGRKIVSSSEIMDKDGVHSVIRRYFAYTVKQVESTNVNKPDPYLYVLKERNSKEKREHFFCKIKGNILAANKGKLLLILFVHTLSIELTETAKLSQQIS
jgi:hypothetical protein